MQSRETRAALWDRRSPAVNTWREVMQRNLVRAGVGDDQHNVVGIAALDHGRIFMAAGLPVSCALAQRPLGPLQVLFPGGGPDQVLHAHRPQSPGGTLA